MEMSGTSMSAAVVSGAAALLLDANPRLSPAEVKLVLQLTSSRVPNAGLIEAGTGSVNVAAAVNLVKKKKKEALGPTEIGGETVRAAAGRTGALY